MSVYSHFILAPFLNGVVGSEKPSNLPEVTQLVKWQNPQTRHSSTYESKALPLVIIQCQGPAPGFRGTAAGGAQPQVPPPAIPPRALWHQHTGLAHQPRPSDSLLVDVVCLLTAVCTALSMGVC